VNASVLASNLYQFNLYYYNMLQIALELVAHYQNDLLERSLENILILSIFSSLISLNLRGQSWHYTSYFCWDDAPCHLTMAAYIFYMQMIAICCCKINL